VATFVSSYGELFYSKGEAAPMANTLLDVTYILIGLGLKKEIVFYQEDKNNVNLWSIWTWS